MVPVVRVGERRVQPDAGPVHAQQGEHQRLQRQTAGVHQLGLDSPVDGLVLETDALFVLHDLFRFGGLADAHAVFDAAHLDDAGAVTLKLVQAAGVV